MIDIEDLIVDDQRMNLSARSANSITEHLLVKAVNDIANEVQNKAVQFAPLGTAEKGRKGYVPGQLKAEGILVDEASTRPFGGDEGIPGSSVSTAHAIGGGFSIRGGDPKHRGRFSKRTSPTDIELQPGHRFSGGGLGATHISAAVRLNPAVRHARWVHEGTGIYGPHHRPIVPRVAPFLVFHWRGRNWVKESVRGQKPQPFLTYAYIYVNLTYTPARLSKLRAELAAAL